MARKLPIKSDPFFNGKMAPLDFGDETESLMEMTPEQKTSKFLSDYMDEENPVGKYSSYFNASAKSTGHLLKDIKLYYKRLVVEGAWDEDKYISALDIIFNEFLELNVVTLDRVSMRIERQKFGSSNSRRRRK